VNQGALFAEPEVKVDLTDYDVILLNTSGGKDSQVMLGVVHALAVEQDVTSRLVAVHADLGRVEWDGVAALAREQAEHYGIRFEIVARPAGKDELAKGLTSGDLLDRIRARGKFPSSAARFCTSDHKRGQIAKVMTQLTHEQRERRAELGLEPRPIRILNCLGFRAEESAFRAKKPVFEVDAQASTKTTRHVDRWLPILGWKVDEIWEYIRVSGVRHHEAYDAGMPRLSCTFCVLAPKSALVLAAQLRPELAAEYAEVEAEIGHTFKHGLSMAEIIVEAAAAETPVSIGAWGG